MKELFNKTLVIRWDLLHLFNRAHIETKGKTYVDAYDLEYNDDCSDSDIGKQLGTAMYEHIKDKI